MGKSKNGAARSRARCAARKTEAEAAKLGKLYMDMYGNLYRALPNMGRGRCGIISLIQAKMVAEGVSRDETLRRTTGELDADIKARMRCLREGIVAAAAGRIDVELDSDPAADGGRTVQQCLKEGDIKSHKMFCDVMSREDGWLDPLALFLGAVHLGLEGMHIVETGKEDGAQKTEEGEETKPQHLYYPTTTLRVKDEACMILLHEKHFEALYKVNRTVFLWNCFPISL